MVCPTCGEVHDLSDMQVGYGKPDAWFAIPRDERDSRAMLMPDDAVIDGVHHFLRVVLEIPIRGQEQPFGWGIWVKVSADDFARYTSEHSSHDPSGPEPFIGHVATLVAGYPCTLGIPVTVRPSGAGLRPRVDVTDPAHALAVEQREGIYPERVLEHLSRFIHAGQPEPLREPWDASIATDGWQLDSALARFRSRDEVYWLPEADDRESIAPGDFAQLIFAIEASDTTGAAEVHRERMWVEVDQVRGEGAERRCTGTLANDPHVPGTTWAGMRVWFRPEHVVDIARGESRASESKDVLRCTRHGASQSTFVCRHVVDGSGLGFHQAEDPGNPRPDAWCDACDALLREEGGEWTERAAEFAGVTLICAGCYDAAEERNRRD